MNKKTTMVVLIIMLLIGTCIVPTVLGAGKTMNKRVAFEKLSLKESNHYVTVIPVPLEVVQAFSVVDDLSGIPNIMEAWSCASHTGITDDIKFPIDPDSEFGVVEPRNQHRDLNSNENDMYVEIVFDRDVDHVDMEFVISPSVSIVVQNSLESNKINIQYHSRIPNGIYNIKIIDKQTQAIIGDFNISYLNGDVTGALNGDGDITGNGVVFKEDQAEIVKSYNWNRALDDYMSRPFAEQRCDVNRDGIVSGLDIARVRNSANWEESLLV